MLSCCHGFRTCVYRLITCYIHQVVLAEHSLDEDDLTESCSLLNNMILLYIDSPVPAQEGGE